MRDHTLPDAKLKVVEDVNRHDLGWVEAEFSVICILGHVSERPCRNMSKWNLTLVKSNDPLFKISSFPPTLLPRSNTSLQACSTRAAASFT